MRAIPFFASVALAGSLVCGTASADAHMSGYTAADLLSPCQEADSDARDGITFETECEQYIMGFVGALKEIGAKSELGICAPEQNTADEVRWAFIRWVYTSYTENKKMPASAALMATLKDNFLCE